MTSNELRYKFLNFFESKGHKVLPSASLVPKDDSSVLFTSAGMQQFRKFYGLPEEAPAATITTCQKCIRTSDIDEVGDATHLTFFEMLGNFSFGYSEKEGSYFKKEAIEYAWEFLTEILKIEKSRISATYFKGEGDIPADNESLSILKEVTGLADDKIKGTGKDETFWSLGTEGSPGGPTVEFYIDGVEIWNLVFNQYIMQGGKYVPSKFQGVDTGMGLERLTAMMQGKNDVFETDLFELIISEIEKISGKKYLCHSERSEESHRDPSATPQDDKKAFRITADHIKAATLLISEDVLPSNKDQGYIVRRLIRRAIVQANSIGVKENFTTKIAAKVHEMYGNSSFCHSREDGNPKIDLSVDPRLRGDDERSNDDKKKVIEELEKEEARFKETLKKGLEIIKSKSDYSPEDIFSLYQSYGIPLEVAEEEIRRVHGGINYKMKLKDEVKVTDEIKAEIIKKDFQGEFEKHRELSRTASAGKFKGGLADAGEETTKLHTTAHLMLAAMRKVLGSDVNQKGSNITAERLRFDFNYPEKLTESQIKEIEDIVNENIKADLPVTTEELSIEDAKNSGATGVFDNRYGDKVKVYTIGPLTGSIGSQRAGSGQASLRSRDFVSREICGGPHAEHTGQLGHFKITKEESSSAGIRRVKAVLE